MTKLKINDTSPTPDQIYTPNWFLLSKLSLNYINESFFSLIPITDYQNINSVLEKQIAN